MKIKLSVDAAFAFDYLSILEIKCIKNSSKQNTDNFYNCQKDIIESLGDRTLFFSIIASNEYLDLYNSNEKVFNLVDLAKDNKCLASEVDKANYERYKSKIALQKKFFNTSLSEAKIGY
jgi:hypothetical protein